MIVQSTVDPLWDSVVQPELRSCRETFGEHCHLLLTSCVYDCPAYCWRSLGLGHTAGAEILQGDVWDSEIQPELRSCRKTSGEHCNLSLLYHAVWSAARLLRHVSLHIHILCGFADDQSEFHYDHNWWKAAG